MARLKTYRERFKNNELPDPQDFKNVEELVNAYDNGFEGAIFDPDGAEEIESGKYGNMHDTAQEFGFAGQGEGKLTLLYPEVWKAAGRSDFFHGEPNQGCGDCVSHSVKHTLMASMAVSANNGQGSWPVMPDSAYKYGAFHPSPTYWLRGKNSDGWSCSTAIKRATDGIGMVQCIDWPSPLNMSLAAYSKSIAHKWGATSPPSDVKNQLGGHKVKASSRCKSWETVRDAISAGYALCTCGGEGFSKTRDSNGVSKRSGSWSHALTYIAADETEWAKKNYGGPLVLILNSWGPSWNGNQGEKPQGNSSLPSIPKGSFWAKWSDVKNRDCYAVSDINSFPNRKLKDWSLRDLI
jgi:hypothetical protein